MYCRRKKLIKSKNGLTKKAFIEWSLIGILALIFLVRIYPIYFTIDDDILTYAVVRHGDLYKWAIDLTKSGRITQFISTIMLGIPMLADQLWIYKFFSYATILFDVYVWYRLVSDFVDQNIAKVTVVLFWGVAVISNWHSLFLSYVFSHQIIIGLVFLSIYFYLQYLQKPVCRAKLIWSIIFYALSVIIYESAVTYILIFVVIGFLYEKNLKRAAYSLIGHIGVTFIFLTVYFVWRKIYPTTYDGVSFFFGDPLGSLWCLFMYSIAAFPLIPMLYSIYSGQLFTFFMQSSLEVYIVACITSLLFGYFISKITWKRNYSKVLFISILGMFLPNIPLCITSKYISWCYDYTFGYLTSYYSWFFMLLAGILCSVWLCSKFQYRRNIRIFLCSCICAISLAAGFFNSGTADILKTQTEKYKAFNDIMNSDVIHNFDNGTNIYMPQYRWINNSEQIMIYYAELYTDKDLYFTNNYDDLDFKYPVIEFRYNQDKKCVEYNHLNP